MTTLFRVGFRLEQCNPCGRQSRRKQRSIGLDYGIITDVCLHHFTRHRQLDQHRADKTMPSDELGTIRWVNGQYATEDTEKTLITTAAIRLAGLPERAGVLTTIRSSRNQIKRRVFDLPSLDAAASCVVSIPFFTMALNEIHRCCCYSSSIGCDGNPMIRSEVVMWTA